MNLKSFYFLAPLIFLNLGLFFLVFPCQEKPLLAQTQETSWYMAGANPQRTSWVPEGPTGKLKPLWYKPIEAYVLPRTQIIAANNTLYLSTAKGLYAFDAITGAEKWVYPTAMPLGHSPSVVNGVVYVAGFDHKLYALNATTGALIWTFEAQQGFQTNPLVVNNTVYLGNRDSYFYAVDAINGSLKWKYKTEGPILFSAAASPDNSTIYFTSNDMHAYALNASNGSLIWKSQKLPGSGFTSWWPVVYRNYVIFGGSHNYRLSTVSFGGQVNNTLDKSYVYKDYSTLPRGTLVGPLSNEPGDWAAGTVTLDTSQFTASSSGITRPITEYYEEMPWRRTNFVLERSTGQEYTTDFDHDDKQEYTPFLWFGTHGGNRYPPIVGGDGVIYQTNSYESDQWIPSGHVVGWKLGSPFISLVSCDWGAVDEPHAYSAGGNVIYWTLIGDRQAGGFNINIPRQIDINHYNTYKTFKCNRNAEWEYYTYNLHQLLPNYYVGRLWGGGPGTDKFCSWCNDQAFASFGSPHGVYNYHYEVAPPIPYQGRLYTLNSNGITAWGTPAPDCATTNCLLTEAKIATPQKPQLKIPSKEELKIKLNDEVQKIITAGHLRPGYLSSGGLDSQHQCTDDFFVDYFHEPWETFSVLQSALPYLASDLQTQVRSYLQQEFTTYPFYQYFHIGWVNGSQREFGETPPEFTANVSKVPAKTVIYPLTNSVGERIPPWSFPPHAFYYTFKYAQMFGGDILTIFNNTKKKLLTILTSPPADQLLIKYPYFLNSYIAGNLGYLELEKLAGLPESASIRTELNRLLALRQDNFSTYPASTEIYPTKYCRALNVSRNFLYLVPELAQYLHDHNFSQVQEAVTEYERITPYWFVSRFESGTGEGGMHHLYDYHSLFQAKAMILKEPYEELVKYLDVPAFEKGDLFYIDNLVAALAAAENKASCEGDLNIDGKRDFGDLKLVLAKYAQACSGCPEDINKDGKVNSADLKFILKFWGQNCP